jgi:hypothetical protein
VVRGFARCWQLAESSMTAMHPDASSGLMSCSQVENWTPVKHADCACGFSSRSTGRRERHSEGCVGARVGALRLLGVYVRADVSPTTGKARLGYRPLTKSIKRMVERVHALTEWRSDFLMSSELRLMMVFQPKTFE